LVRLPRSFISKFMKLKLKLREILLLACVLLWCSPSLAAVWQWSTEIDSAVSGETRKPARAFLWIPENCKQLRGVVVGQHNMEEEPILQSPQFRQTLSELGFAEIWVSPAFDLFFRFDRGAEGKFNEMMKRLAAVSGYNELEFVPVVPLGHSAAASYPWNFGALKPERTLAVISVSGQWPYYKDQNTPDWGDRNVDFVPGLVTMGEYEAAESRGKVGAGQHFEHPNTPLSMLAEPGGGHFEAGDAKINFICLYLKKAAQYRLPAKIETDRVTPLNKIDPAHDGVLADRWIFNQKPRAPIAAPEKYQGDKKEAFWFFDEELAKAAEDFQASYGNKKFALLGYVQNGEVVPQNPRLHEQVPLKFLPLDDGISFKLTGTFLDTVPEGRPEGWTGLPKGSAVEQPSGSVPVEIRRICGPVEKVSDDTWRLAFYCMGMDNAKRSNSATFIAIYPGDDKFRRSLQQAVLWFPLTNTTGKDQKITFNEIMPMRAGEKSTTLTAKSSSGLPVYFYVREGPAEIKDNTLTLTSIPPRAKFPVKITVVAWQWGRSTDPKVKTAEPVVREILVSR